MTFELQLERIRTMLESSGCSVEILPPDKEKSQKLLAQGGDEFSPLAAVLAGTGGIIVNNILRIYGCGELDFFERNDKLSELGFTAVAEDIFGGIFGLDKSGILFYLMPDELHFEEFGEDYNELLDWACSREELDDFYAEYKEQCSGVLFEKIPADKGISLYPPLWEQADEKRAAAAVPMEQLLSVEIGIMQKISENAEKSEENDASDSE